MKTNLTTFFILVLVNISFSQVTTKITGNDKIFEDHPEFGLTKQSSPQKTMPEFDLLSLLEEDELTKDLDLRFKFGKSFDVNITLKDGKWLRNDSLSIWSLQINSHNAYSLNFIFSELYLPNGAELYIYNTDGSVVYGPVTEEQITSKGNFLSDVIPGESVILHLSIPTDLEKYAKLTISNVIHGYKDIYKSMSTGYGQSASCNNDVACFPNWGDEADGIVQILLSSGDEWCSGALLNNTAQDYKPYILTAFHCIDIGTSPAYSTKWRDNCIIEDFEEDNVNEWLVRFQFRHTTCDGSTFDNVRTYNGAIYRAGWCYSDFALVELYANLINSNYGFGEKLWLGWDRTGNNPTEGTCIHHPMGDVAKLAYDEDYIVETDSMSHNNGTGFWCVNVWDEGIMEECSSGAPLFDQNKRVVGQHMGGSSTCQSPGSDWFGAFHYSWTGGGTNSTRLSNWLQPAGAPTATTLNSLRPPIPTYSGGSDPLCSTGNPASISVVNLAPGYYVSSWSGGNVDFPNGNTSNPVQIIASSDNGEMGWVQATINTGGGLYTIDKEYFWTGVPDDQYLDMSATMGGDDKLIPGELNQIVATYTGPGEPIIDHDWGSYSGWSHFEVGTDHSISFFSVPYNFSTYEDIYVSAQNTCGSSPNHYKRFYPLQYYYFSIYPNPADEYIELSIAPENEIQDKTSKIKIEKATGDKGFGEYTIEIRNENGSLLKSVSSSRTNLQLSTRDLWPGRYFVHLITDGKIYKQQLIIEK